ncbi:MAG: bacillithiol biosynthesis deacetylase BshB1 [Candidatus Scalindua sp. AMX11]|nr:MAG: bacillithiol biosynthesis deacetylase BshB1 [Candidatus Scalindua sp.]NOG83357.1 bacillithiol biosynthesis deacetylase BshB1 [Planctomycetota bacterium]RZV76742.1 MAG: bacillithiol biosynthesis deacetylase BshB1 [Candidatus Scalindua sp. SCAELEC01]TDE63359.1 MAG: bacillithiol biosynthesis deacetylase BshB1 [Candidatus Scalindua sp. AMX11]GJQ57360.1 MAG: bacillithiol biosynthesis deacetylase BshB1 [Candidatus Scalindua sp.]
MTNSPSTVLAVSPHPDDVECGMGGSIIKLLKLGHKVHVVDLTNGEPTPHGTPELRRRECEKATDLLALTSRITLDFPNRYLFDNVEVRYKVAEVIRKVKPEILFLPFWEDAHPDHVQAAQIGEAARFYAKLTKTDMAGDPWYPKRIFYYQWTHMRVQFPPAFILDISDEFEKKVKVVKTYESQFAFSDDRWNSVSGSLHAYGHYYGELIGTRYGEPFACREKIGLRDIGGLI